MELRITWTSVLAAVLGVVAVAVIGSRFSSMNRDWYRELAKPSWQPPNWIFPVAWTTIFLLCIVSIILIWNMRPQSSLTYWVMGILIVNGVLNVLWSVLFFGNRLIYPAIFNAGLLCISVIAAIIAGWRLSVAGAILLIPYAAWTAFATILTWKIYSLNGLGLSHHLRAS